MWQLRVVRTGRNHVLAFFTPSPVNDKLLRAVGDVVLVEPLPRNSIHTVGEFSLEQIDPQDAEHQEEE